MTENGLVFTGITKSFPDLNVLGGLDFSVAPGEFVAIIGPSGCGKTTLLKIAGGIEQPTRGAVSFGGAAIANCRRNGTIGYVSQKPALLPWRTVVENVCLPRDLISDLPKQTVAVSEILECLELTGFGQFYPARLSGGMQQRVALGRLLAHQPSLILMDEPFSALDEITREHMARQTLKIWRELNATLLFVTHQISEAIAMADRILVLSARPASVIREIPVTLQRPRRTDIQMSNEYREVQTCLRHELGLDA